MGAMNLTEITELKMSRIPEKVFNAFNKAIADNLSKGYAYVTQEEVVVLILSEMAGTDIDRHDIFNNGWLDVEPFYEMKGWTVTSNKPGFNETYEPSWEFKAKRNK